MSSSEYRSGRHKKFGTDNPDNRQRRQTGNRIWIARHVSPDSYKQLRDLAKLALPANVIKVRSKMAMTLVYPGTLVGILERSERKFSSVPDFAEAIEENFPRSLRRPIIANVIGLRQHQQDIDVQVSYPGLEEDALLLSAVIKRLTSVDRRSPKETYITLGFGQLDRVQNLEQVENALPATIGLTRLHANVN